MKLSYLERSLQKRKYRFVTLLTKMFPCYIVSRPMRLLHLYPTYAYGHCSLSTGFSFNRNILSSIIQIAVKQWEYSLHRFSEYQVDLDISGKDSFCESQSKLQALQHKLIEYDNLRTFFIESMIFSRKSWYSIFMFCWAEGLLQFWNSEQTSRPRLSFVLWFLLFST